MACPALPTGAASFKEANGTTSSKISSGTHPISVASRDETIRILTSIAPRPARESVAERRDLNGVGKGAREPRRREAPSHMLKRISKMQNLCIITQNAPRVARESLAECGELMDAGREHGHGGGAERRLLRSV
ncbi:hypothetical protein EV715DRAFT_292960 [Schizophyllum commune]